MSLLSNFPHKCRIERRTRTSTNGGGLGGGTGDPVVEQTDVECWEMAAGDAEVDYYQKRDMKINKKVYFLTDPQVTERHTITITERFGVEVDEDDQVPLDVVSKPIPDCTAGLGVAFKVMVLYVPGASR